MAARRSHAALRSVARHSSIPLLLMLLLLRRQAAHARPAADCAGGLGADDGLPGCLRPGEGCARTRRCCDRLRCAAAAAAASVRRFCHARAAAPGPCHSEQQRAAAALPPAPPARHTRTRILLRPLLTTTVAELLRLRGLPNVLFWSEDPSALVAAHFSAALFSMLALESNVTLLEAYALSLFATQVRLRSAHSQRSCIGALAAFCARLGCTTVELAQHARMLPARHATPMHARTQAHLGAKVDGKLTMPNMPDLLTGPPDHPDSVVLALPDNGSVPPPNLPGVDLSRGVAAAVEGAIRGRSASGRLYAQHAAAAACGLACVQLQRQLSLPPPTCCCLPVCACRLDGCAPAGAARGAARRGGGRQQHGGRGPPQLPGRGAACAAGAGGGRPGLLDMHMSMCACMA